MSRTLATAILALLSVAHGITGAVTVVAAARAMTSGAAGVLGGVFLGFFGLVLLIAAGAGVRICWRSWRSGDATEPATFLLIGMMAVNIFSPVGAGPLLPLVEPEDNLPLRLGVVVLAGLGIWLFRRRPQPHAE